MNEIILNEKSLQGQYASMDEFVECIPPFLGSVKYFMKQENWRVLKRSDLFRAHVTKSEMLYKIRENRTDEARKIKGILCQMSDEPPYWDMEPRQSGSYLENGTEMAGTSVAEAAARSGYVLSFPKSAYEDREIEVLHGDERENVSSITSMRYGRNILYQRGFLDIDTYLKEHYRGTRLNFEKFESEYGFCHFEKEEIAECLEYFERFAEHKDWTEIAQDAALRYKEYKPSRKENWFLGSPYEDMTIHKFRCGNPKRCFGFRQGDVFYVLRMERDHSISDKG